MTFNAIFGVYTFLFAQVQETGIITVLQQKFIAGGFFMWPILFCLVIGLGFCFERFWTLSRSNIDAKRFIVQIKEALESGGVEKAIMLCQNTRGSIASVFHAGLLRADEGIDAAEKAIMAYGSIEMSFLEK